MANMMGLKAGSIKGWWKNRVISLRNSVVTDIDLMSTSNEEVIAGGANST